MNARVRRLFNDALDLPESDRIQLAELLLESVAPALDEQLQSEWEAEIARRVQELETGAVKTIPWPEVRRRLYEGIDLTRVDASQSETDPSAQGAGADDDTRD